MLKTVENLRKSERPSAAIIKDRDGRAGTAASPVVESDLLAGFVDELKKLPDTRAEKIEALRKEIQSGKYETEEKIEKALPRILEDLRDPP